MHCHCLHTVFSLGRKGIYRKGKLNLEFSLCFFLYLRSVQCIPASRGIRCVKKLKLTIRKVLASRIALVFTSMSVGTEGKKQRMTFRVI